MIGCSDPPAGSSWGGRVAFRCVFSVLLRPLVAESLEDFFERDELRRGERVAEIQDERQKVWFSAEMPSTFFFFLFIITRIFLRSNFAKLKRGRIKKGRMKSADFFFSPLTQTPSDVLPSNNSLTLPKN